MPLGIKGFQKGRAKTGGRKKGTLNSTIKEDVNKVFAMIGGIEAQAEWAKENRTEFYKLRNQHRDSDKGAPGSAENPTHSIVTIPGLFDGDKSN